MRKLVTGIALMALAVSGMVLSPAAHAVVGGGVLSVKCTFSHSAQVDPIVAPGPLGTPSAHQHDFFGARATNSNSTLASMQAGGTTCPLPFDTAGYWVPSLYKNGAKVTPRHMFIYYRSPSGRVVTPFPPDLRMLAGGDTRTPPAPDRSQRSLSWACSQSAPFSAQPMDCGSRKLKMHIHFPDCWNGTSIDSPDHRSHMTFKTGGNCPASHPILMPRVTMHVTFDLTDGRGATLTSDMGAPNGTQLHADFWNTWNQGAFQFLVSRCLDGGLDCKQITLQRMQRLMK